jgi:sulfotransferase famil protein
MIISHEHKFIFIKTMKTAGTSLEIALSKFCGPRDVITPITPPDEEIRRSLGYRGPQNYLIPFSQYSSRDWLHLVTRRNGRRQFYNHINARQIRRSVDSDVWNAYFKFCVERNPWDKVISWYFWRHQTEPRPTLSEFIESGEMSLGARRGGFDRYAIDGKVAVDHVCRYEHLRKELEFVTERLKFPEVPQLPRAKGAARTDRQHYRELLTPHDRQQIAQVFAREIAYFNYEF